jgi:hypothetical protein
MTDPGKALDASVGLAFSLKAFELYRKSGLLSAEIRSMPGIRGKCMAYLELNQGKVVASYLVDKTGARHSAHLQTLVQVDTEKGPFSWVFQDSPAPTRPRSPVPQLLVHNLDPHLFQQLPIQQQQCIHFIFSLIDGQLSIDDIKAKALFPPSAVDETMRILLSLRIITLQ